MRRWWIGMVAAVGCFAQIARAGPVPLTADSERFETPAVVPTMSPEPDFNALTASPISAARPAMSDTGAAAAPPNADVSPEAVAMIPLPPPLWSGALGLSTLATAAVVRRIRRQS